MHKLLFLLLITSCAVPVKERPNCVKVYEEDFFGTKFVEFNCIKKEPKMTCFDRGSYYNCITKEKR